VGITLDLKLNLTADLKLNLTADLKAASRGSLNLNLQPKP
jgi:hypothetical protein